MKKIIAEVQRQAWDRDEAVDVGRSEQFDVTSLALSVDYKTIRSEYIPELAQTMVREALESSGHDGPYTADFTDGLTAYFGVTSISQITPDAWASARVEAGVSQQIDAPRMR